VTTDLYKLVPKDFRKNLIFRREVAMRGFRDEGYARAIWQMCEEDPLFYINTFAVTYDPRIKASPAQPFISYEFQDELFLEILQAIEEEKSCDLLIEKSRDMGVTYDCLYAFEYLWHFKPLQSFLLGSRTEDYVDRTDNPKSLFWKIDFMHEHQPAWLLPTGRDLGAKDRNRTHMHLKNADNGSVIDGEASGKDFGRGDRRTAVFLDEFAADENGSAANAACADTSPVRIFNSTPQGTGNEFYVIKASGRAKVLTYHWRRHPVKAAGLYKSKRGRLDIIDTDHRFPKDYPFKLDDKYRSPWYDHECSRRADWQVAQELDINYEGSDKQFFNVDMMESIALVTCRPPLYRGELMFDWNYDDKSVSFDEMLGGRLEVWSILDFEKNPDPNTLYTVGCDVATGKGGTLSTNSVASVLSNLTGEQAAEFATKDMTPTEFAEYVVAICRYFHNAFLAWEDNGPGGEFGKKVLELGYHNIYYRRSNEKSKANGRRTTPGWWSNQNNKRELLSGFGEAVRTSDYLVRSNPVIEEAKGYVFDKGKIVHSHSKSSASPDNSETGDNHGDRVIAAALSVHARKERPKQPVDAADRASFSKMPEHCVAARLKKRQAKNKKRFQEAW